MNHKAHMLAGIISGLAITGFLQNYESKENAIVGGIACFLGAEFPDIDCGSIPSRVAARVGTLFAGALVYFDYSFYAALIGIIYMFVKGQPHRGFTHSYSLPLVLFIFAALIIPQYSIILTGLGIGLVVHYALDFRNPFNPLNWLPV